MTIHEIENEFLLIQAKDSKKCIRKIYLKIIKKNINMLKKWSDHLSVEKCICRGCSSETDHEMERSENLVEEADNFEP